MTKCSDISEERVTSVFSVTELVQVDAEVIKRKNICAICRNCLREFGQ